MGPIAGGFLSQARIVAEQQSWRWVFYLTSMVAFIPAVLGGIFLRETFAPVLLKRKVSLLIKRTGNPNLKSIHHKDESVSQLIEKGLVRPFIMLFTQPIVIILSIYSAILFGTYVRLPLLIGSDLHSIYSTYFSLHLPGLLKNNITNGWVLLLSITYPWHWAFCPGG